MAVRQKMALLVKLLVNLPNFNGVNNTEIEDLHNEICIVYFMFAIFSIRDNTFIVSSSAMT